MNTFYIYPVKSNADALQLKFEKFVFSNGRFILFDYADRASSLGYLNADNIAAIHIPNDKPRDNRSPYGMRTFHIHLIGRAEPLAVDAHDFRVSDDQVEFFTKYSAHAGHSSYFELIKNAETYVKLSEVLAVIPSTGLEYVRS